MVEPVDLPNSESLAMARLRLEALKAIQSRDTEKLKAIMQQAGDPRLLDAKLGEGDYQGTLLDWAIRSVALDAVRVLLDSGADPTHCQRDNGFSTLFTFACNSTGMKESSQRAIVEMLSAAGADLNATDKEGWTPLHYAIFTGAPQLAAILIEHGVRIDPKLLNDPETERRIVPPLGELTHFSATEALRTVRALVLERGILSAMSPEGDAAATPSPGIRL